MPVQDSVFLRQYQLSREILSRAKALEWLPDEVRENPEAPIPEEKEVRIGGFIGNIVSYCKLQKRGLSEHEEIQIDELIDMCRKIISEDNLVEKIKNNPNKASSKFFTIGSYAFYCAGEGCYQKAECFDEEDKKPDSERWQEYQDLLNEALFYISHSIWLTNDPLPRTTLANIKKEIEAHPDFLKLDIELTYLAEEEERQKSSAAKAASKGAKKNKKKDAEESALDDLVNSDKKICANRTNKGNDNKDKELRVVLKGDILLNICSLGNKGGKKLVAKMEYAIESCSFYTNLTEEEIENLSLGDSEIRKTVARAFEISGAAHYYIAYEFLKNPDLGKFNLVGDYFLRAQTCFEKSHPLNPPDSVLRNSKKVKKVKGIFEGSIKKTPLQLAAAQEEVKQEEKQEDEQKSSSTSSNLAKHSDEKLVLDLAREREFCFKIYEYLETHKPDIKIPPELRDKAIREYVAIIISRHENCEDKSQVFNYEAIEEVINILLEFARINKDPLQNSDNSFTVPSYVDCLKGWLYYIEAKYFNEDDKISGNSSKDYRYLLNKAWFCVFKSFQFAPGEGFCFEVLDDIWKEIELHWPSFQLGLVLNVGNSIRESSPQDKEIYAAAGYLDKGDMLDRLCIIIREEFGKEDFVETLKKEILLPCKFCSESKLKGKLKENLSESEKELAIRISYLAGLALYCQAYHNLKGSRHDLNLRSAVIGNFNAAKTNFSYYKSLSSSPAIYESFKEIEEITLIFKGITRAIEFPRIPDHALDVMPVYASSNSLKLIQLVKKLGGEIIGQQKEMEKEMNAALIRQQEMVSREQGEKSAKEAEMNEKQKAEDNAKQLTNEKLQQQIAELMAQQNAFKEQQEKSKQEIAKAQEAAAVKLAEAEKQKAETSEQQEKSEKKARGLVEEERVLNEKIAKQRMEESKKRSELELESEKIEKQKAEAIQKIAESRERAEEMQKTEASQKQKELEERRNDLDERERQLKIQQDFMRQEAARLVGENPHFMTASSCVGFSVVVSTLTRAPLPPEREVREVNDAFLSESNVVEESYEAPVGTSFPGPMDLQPIINQESEHEADSEESSASKVGSEEENVVREKEEEVSSDKVRHLNDNEWPPLVPSSSVNPTGAGAMMQNSEKRK
ncbi:MAG: hypothetical protein K0R25_399 [Rickettsiaceae bacterium]|jgi:hypothetical protein|nr:hypothetical protein [Rickettsiaceae bacterium]